MATFADIQKHAQGTVDTFVNDATPAGHFGATTLIMGNLVTYLIEGEQGTPEAPVKGSVMLVERNGILAAIGYTNGSLIGGQSIGLVPNFEDAFAQMV